MCGLRAGVGANGYEEVADSTALHMLADVAIRDGHWGSKREPLRAIPGAPIKKPQWTNSSKLKYKSLKKLLFP